VRLAEVAEIRRMLRKEDARLALLLSEARASEERRREDVPRLRVEIGKLKMQNAELQRRIEEANLAFAAK
jgi:ribosomal protein L1